MISCLSLGPNVFLAHRTAALSSPEDTVCVGLQNGSLHHPNPIRRESQALASVLLQHLSLGKSEGWLEELACFSLCRFSSGSLSVS